MDVNGQFPDSLIGQDGLHPTEEGYQRIAEVFLDAMKSAMNRPRWLFRGSAAAVAPHSRSEPQPPPRVAVNSHASPSCFELTGSPPLVPGERRRFRGVQREHVSGTGALALEDCGCRAVVERGDGGSMKSSAMAFCRASASRSMSSSTALRPVHSPPGPCSWWLSRWASMACWISAAIEVSLQPGDDLELSVDVVVQSDGEGLLAALALVVGTHVPTSSVVVRPTNLSGSSCCSGTARPHATDEAQAAIVAFPPCWPLLREWRAPAIRSWAASA